MTSPAHRPQLQSAHHNRDRHHEDRLTQDQCTDANPPQDRRSWMASLAQLTAAGVCLPHAAARAWAADPESSSRAASESDSGTSQSANFLWSLAAYSYRSLLQGDRAELTLFDFIDDCVRFGLHGTELTSYYFEQPVTDGYLLRLKHHCFRNGIEISGTAIRCDFAVPAGSKRDAELEQVQRWIDRAALLGAPVIRIFAGHQAAGQSAEKTHALIVEGIQASCDYAAKCGVHLALENHGGPTSTADGLMKIVNDVESDWFGVNLDTGNFHSDDIYGELEAVAPRAINVQVKVVTKGPDGQIQPTDFSRIAAILRNSGYRGYVVLEYEEAGDPRAESKRYLDLMRDAFATST